MRTVALGLACNNACIFCAQGRLREERAPVDVSVVDAQLSTIEPGDHVAFVGGEPTLHDPLPTWLRAAEARRAARIILQTNGRRLAYASYAQALAAASSHLSLDVSLHGSTEAMHDYHTGVDGSFRQTVLGLRHARASHVPTFVTTVITRSNFRHLLEILRVLDASGVRGQQLVVALPFGSAGRAADRVVPALELIKPHVLRAVSEARQLGIALRVGDQTSDPDLLERFAGLGESEPNSPEPRRGAAEPPSHVSLGMLGRPTPATQEKRAATRRTGADLRAIFPDLFAGGDGNPATFTPRSAADLHTLAISGTSESANRNSSATPAARAATAGGRR
jgi:MoaA/NifB/PqqE/SkfB family radical SAM enzyme